MAKTVIMPRQGQSVESCVITLINKNTGDSVAEGDLLFSYETDKSSFEEKSDVSGVVRALLYSEGDEVECLAPVMIIAGADEDIASLLPPKGAVPQPAAAPVSTAKPEVAASAAPLSAPEKSSGVSPRARRLAEKLDADLSAVTPGGPNGRIIERDVYTAVNAGKTANMAPKSVAAGFREENLSNIRKLIARSMQASLANSAQLTLNSSFDASQIIAFRDSVKKYGENRGIPNITYNDMVLFAAAYTLMDHKALNAHLDGDTIRYFDDVCLGIAVDTERGLLVPALPGANLLSLSDISKRAKSLIAEAQSGRIDSETAKSATFTVTNLGSLGVESFTPVINPPQTGILGVDNITYGIRQDGSPYPRMGLSLTFDHRALDGAPAARFLKDLCENLEHFSLFIIK